MNGHGSVIFLETGRNGINITSILVAFVGAVILIAILRLFSGRRHSSV